MAPKSHVLYCLQWLLSSWLAAFLITKSMYCEHTPHTCTGTSPVTFPNLRSPGRHVFKITPFGCGINRFPVTFYADIGNAMIAICRVSMTQPIAVQGNSATLHFMGSGPYQSFTCFVDRGGAVYRNCECTVHVLYHDTMCSQPVTGNSPFAVSNLTAGKHFIKIRPDGPGCIPWPNRRPLRVDFSIE